MKNALIGVVALVVLVAGYLGYRYWQIQQMAAKYATAKEIAAASISKDGRTWTLRFESVIGEPIDAVWKALRQPERSAELVPTAFKRSALVKEEGNKKILELQVTLLSLPAQTMTAELTYDDAAKHATITTSKGLQDINADYDLTSLAADKTLLVFAGTAVENASLPVPQSVIEGALRELFVVQIRAIQSAIRGPGKGATTEVAAAPPASTKKFCEGAVGAETTKALTVSAAKATAPAEAPSEYRKDLPDGYERGYAVGGFAVKEVFKLTTRCTTATATAGKFVVQIQAVILAPESIPDWVKNTKLADIAALDEAADKDKLLAAFPEPPRGWNVVPPEVPPTLPSAVAHRVYEQGLF